MRKKERTGKIAALLLLLILAAAGITAALISQKKTEIVWYLTDPAYYGGKQETFEPYQEVEAKRFERFNQRLKELGIPAEVVFRYAPYDPQVEAEGQMDGSAWYSKRFQLSGQKIKALLEADPEADITEFAPMEYRRFLPLDPYFETEGMKKAKAALPEEIWQANRIRGNTFQIPRGNASIQETVYCFRQSFLETYQVLLEEEKIRQMTPQEVIAWLRPYFEKERVLDGKYYLTSAGDLCYSNYLAGRAKPLLEGVGETLFLHLADRKVKDIFSLEEMRSGLKLYQSIYQDELDAHDTPEGMTAAPVFTITDIPSVPKLQREGGWETMWREIPLGNPHLTVSKGNGVLTGSRNQELAVEVLAAAAYDEELSNLMIYGVPEEDYRLEDGHAVYADSRPVSSMGSFSAVGNNLIAYPNEAETADKEEETRKLLRETPVLPYGGFIPDWNGELLDKAGRLAALYQEVLRTLENTEVPDEEQYWEEQQETLREEGLEEVLQELQEQVDTWEE